ncbi:hypothetical protein CYR52_16260 [Chimaeribacter arupi]|nr:hypothetical protein CYR52_16260 [Chimaeribacter arupi]
MKKILPGGFFLPVMHKRGAGTAQAGKGRPRSKRLRYAGNRLPVFAPAPRSKKNRCGQGEWPVC